MKVIQETIGNTTVIIQMLEEDVEFINGSVGRETEPTGIGDSIEGVYDKMKKLIKEVAVDFGNELRTLKSLQKPKTIEIGFQIGMSASVGPVVILGAGISNGLSVKMTWDLKKDDAESR
jgi:hypothetical protein